MKTANEIRNSFLSYFKNQGHTIAPSSPLIPPGDPTLLFTSAGMVQFKPYFLGLKDDIKRAATCQKCFRTTDIDRVGSTIRHFTFFEMLGNFSFGDYFKKESAAWGWEFLTKEIGLDQKRLYISVYGGGIAPRDEEALKLWNGILPPHIKEGRIRELGDDTNFWTMGATGPCGPCSEIYWDRGEEYGHPGCFGPGCDCDRYIEIWNHVFTQFDRQEDGSFKPLPRKNIDTGMGLERLVFAAQGKDSPFETDLLLPAISAYLELAKKPSTDSGESAQASHIIADHARASLFLANEGITPSNEGRGYILRRIIRRASRYGRLMGMKKPFICDILPAVIETYKNVYPEISENKEIINETIKNEEERFIETLETGEKRIKDLLAHYPRQIPGKEVFSLYETYGFPPELTREIALKHDRSIDEKGFEEAKNKAQQTAKAKWKGSGAKDTARFHEAEKSLTAAKFVGYEKIEHKTKILGLFDLDCKAVHTLPPDREGYVVLEETPFYAESGGQTGDSGDIISVTGAKLAEILDTQKPLGKIIFHKALARKELRSGAEVIARVSKYLRNAAACNHTAVHLVNSALRQIIGKTMRQAGSFVTPEKFRFDYTVSSALSKEQILKVEEIANNAISENYTVYKAEKSLKDAEKLGAVTLLGETYADPARLILINHGGWEKAEDRFSLELCGGTHAGATGELMTIKILKDSAVSAGVRRIEGLAGHSAVTYFNKTAATAEFLAKQFSSAIDELPDRIEQLIAREKELKQEIHELRKRLAEGTAAAPADSAKLKNGANLTAVKIDGTSASVLRSVSDKFKAENKNAVLVAVSENKGKISFVVSLTADRKDLKPAACDIAKAIAADIGGSAGGRPDFAQGGGNAPADWNNFKTEIKKIIETLGD